MDMTVKAPRRENSPFARNNLSSWSYDDINVRLCVGISRLPDRCNASIAHGNVCFVYSSVIKDQRIGDNSIRRPLRAGALGLPHTIADHFAAAEFDLFTIGRKIAFHLDNDFCIGKTNFIACCWTIHTSIIKA